MTKRKTEVLPPRDRSSMSLREVQAAMFRGEAPFIDVAVVETEVSDGSVTRTYENGVVVKQLVTGGDVPPPPRLRFRQ